MGHELLYKLGDDPLEELMGMDRFYGWSVRIARLRSLFQPEKKSNIWIWVVLFLALLLLAVLMLSGAAYLILFS